MHTPNRFVKRRRQYIEPDYAYLPRPTADARVAAAAHAGDVRVAYAKNWYRCGSVTQVKPAAGCNGPIPGAAKR